MSIPKCLVLLSTYNGETYIYEQLNSLIKQEGVHLNILIRDDGSNDSTVNIINHFINQTPEKISLIQSVNIGAKASFFDLIRIADTEYPNFDYYAFCDQDDVWLPKKLLKATSTMKNFQNNQLPLMYCSATQMVDANLSDLKVWPLPPKKKLTMYNALVENVAVGCTTVLNREAFQLIASSPPAEVDQVIMHDWWVYLCVSTFGKVIFDSQPLILYRQHSNNVLGGQTDSWLDKWKKRFRRYLKGQNHYIISNQAKEFYKCFQQQLDNTKNLDVWNLIQASGSGPLSRISYALRTPLYRQKDSDQYILKLIICMGKI
ncbi:glycosyltransferase family 2 protein [Paenibacillus barengoltzii]|uniref:Glycosyltransferases involved in cell wall biogenesis n=1 Tax=Paenibacillus barengoltzii J12 TaxID=935846 RepID=A0ABY1M178_9BACL|nr:glycosyltransferase family 2 protein [Paenibacillus barengoltzii]SMF53442.1 Glycosyltransferases involved in cell wall biogenesis [Paenibacillus barengoltzii J12]